MPIQTRLFWPPQGSSGSAVRQAVGLLFLAGLLALAGAGIFAPPPLAVGPGEVSWEQTLAWGSRVLWIDARQPQDFKLEHVPQALNLNEDAWNEQLPAVIEAWSPERIVVVYCNDQRCHNGQDVVQRIKRELQWEPVWILAGGWQQWQRVQP